MKNIQIIDGAENCTFPVHAVSDADFRLLFPGEGQDLEFMEDVAARLGEQAAAELNRRVSYPDSRVSKHKVAGIHGTLFYGLAHRRVCFPTKREAEMRSGV